MAMKIGVSIYSVPDQSMSALINFAEKYHFDTIEVWSAALTWDNRKLKKFLNGTDTELTIHGPLLDLGNKNRMDSNSSRLKETIELANHWEVNKVVIHTGTLKDCRMVDGIKNARYVIETNLDVLKNLGVILCIENTGYLGNDLIKDFGALAAFVDKFPKNLVGVAFDIAHANIMDGVLTGLRTLTKRIRHVHLADNNKLPQNHHMPIGKGSIDFKPIFKTLTSKDLTIILEITPDSAWQKNLMDGRQFLLDRMN